MNLKSDIWLAQRVTLPMAQPSQIEGRLRAVLASRRVRKTLPRSVRIVAAVVMLSLTAVLAALRPVAQATPITPVTEQPTPQVVVVVDAGHGGKDTGVVAADGTFEKDLNLTIALRLKDTLAHQGTGVAMTRTADNYVPLMERPDFANKQQAQLLVSLHCDGREILKLHGGTVVYYHGQDARGRQFASDVLAGLSHRSDLAPYQIKSDTTRFTQGFGVLRGFHAPAVLVECGAMNNARDLAALRNPQEQQKIAEGIAAGVRKFLSDNPHPIRERQGAASLLVPVQQTSRPTATTPTTPAQAVTRLKQIYGFIQVYRQTHGGAYPATMSSPGDLMSDIEAHPKNYDLADLGVNNGRQAVDFFALTKPGASGPPNVITIFMHGKRPDGTRVGSAKRPGTRDVLAYTNIFVNNKKLAQGWRTVGYNLVLWGDGNVTRIPVDKMLSVPLYDTIGAAPLGKGVTLPTPRQLAFPGQAGLPAKGIQKL